MRVDYVIVDQKQLNIFYTLQSQDYANLEAIPSIKNRNSQALSGYSISSHRFDHESDELLPFVVDFQMPICRLTV